MTEDEKAFADKNKAAYCIAVHSPTMGLLLALSWWAQRQRWLAMEADTLALQDLRVEVPKRSDLGVALIVRLAGIGITWTDGRISDVFQFYPSPVWEPATGWSRCDYSDLSGRTKGTNDRAIVCREHTFSAYERAAILTDDPDAADWIREKAKADVFASPDLSTLEAFSNA